MRLPGKLPSSKQLFVDALKLHQAVYEGTRGLVGHRILLGMPALMLRTTGRRTGQIRTNALVYGKDADRWLVCASNGGHRKPPAWLLNLEAHPEVRAVADTDALVAAPLDVYSPCALGDALTDEVVATLRATIVCGAANNQLAHPGVEKQLADRGILYAPDYVVNAGGLIQVADELHGFDYERARSRATLILDTTREVFALAEAEGVPPAVAADRIAEQRMADAASADGDRGIWLP